MKLCLSFNIKYVRCIKNNVSIGCGYGYLTNVVITDDDGGGEVSNDIQARYKPRKLDSEADFLRLDKIRELDMLNQSASQEGSISGTQDEVIR